jgi:hypothetical protein
MFCGEIACPSFETPHQGYALTGASMRYAFLSECILHIVAFMAFLSVVQFLSFFLRNWWKNSLPIQLTEVFVKFHF